MAIGSFDSEKGSASGSGFRFFLSKTLRMRVWFGPMNEIVSDLHRRLEGKRLSMMLLRKAAVGHGDSILLLATMMCVSPLFSLHDGVRDIQYKASGDLDHAGWDLRKALLLAEKSNPRLIGGYCLR
jgi:hypothetical protein